MKYVIAKKFGYRYRIWMKWEILSILGNLIKWYHFLKHFELDLGFTTAIYLFKKFKRCLKCLCAVKAKFFMSKANNKLKS